MLKSLRLPFERLLFCLLLCVALLPLWTQRFFVTGDGPCHVYNARVFLDFVLGRYCDFYRPFYHLNTNFEPNWVGHLCLALLQTMLAPEIAERVFLSIYVVVFGTGLRYLIRQINPGSVFLSSVGLLFIWHFLAQAGFYNYTCSIALFFWVTGIWLKYREAWTNPRLLGLAFLWLLLYSAHPVGLLFSGVFIGCSILWESAFLQSRSRGWPGVWDYTSNQIWNTALAALPMLVLLAEYFYRRPWGGEPNNETTSLLTERLLTLSSLITLNSTERDTVKGIGIFLSLLFVGASWFRWRSRRWVSGDFLLLFLGIVVWQYFYQAGHRAMEVMLAQRIQIFIFLALLCWIATADFPVWTRSVVPGIAAVFLGVLLYIRLPILHKASALIEEYLSCLPYIEERSVILVLNYDVYALDDKGNNIANRNPLFSHAADYLGAYKPAIMSDNYEALRSYFPLNWRWQRNTFSQTDKDGINFGHSPPRADILSYYRRSEGFHIDYVLLLHYDQRHSDHPYSREIQDQLQQAYRLVHHSSGGKAQLWQRQK